MSDWSKKAEIRSLEKSNGSQQQCIDSDYNKGDTNNSTNTKKQQRT